MYAPAGTGPAERVSVPPVLSDLVSTALYNERDRCRGQARSRHKRRTAEDGAIQLRHALLAQGSARTCENVAWRHVRGAVEGSNPQFNP
eukprot:6886448-Prymnesium_polylepis.1